MRRFNMDELLWFIVIIIMGIWMMYLIKSGLAQYYVGNDMIKYLYIGVLLLFIMAVFQIANIFTPPNNSDIKIKIIPIVLMIMIGIISLSLKDNFKHLQIKEDLIQDSGHDEHHHIHDKDIKKEEEKAAKYNYITIDEKNAFILDSINSEPEKYINKKIELHGFICKESYLGENQFIVGRIIMTCCAADAYSTGLICESDKKNEFEENDNVIVKGKLGYSYVKDEKNKDLKIPAVIVDYIKKE